MPLSLDDSPAQIPDYSPASESWFRVLFEQTSLPTLLLDSDRCVDANPAALALFGVKSPGEIVGGQLVKAPSFAETPGHESGLTDLFQAPRGQRSFTFEREYARAAGGRFHARVIVSMIEHAGRSLAHVVITDITEQKSAMARIEYLAYHDILTALPNREHGGRRLRQAIATADRSNSRLAVLYLDLDNFKRVNDTHGHGPGDELLQCAADRMRDWVGGNDGLSRLAGDEFMVVLPDVADRDQVEAACAQLQARLAEPFEVGGHRVAISASIGVALYPLENGERCDAESLMRYADTALLEAKKQGENRRVFFEPVMNAKRLSYAQTRDALRRALDREELTLCYQPQVDLRTGCTVGVEALFRWRRPDGSLALPSDLVGIAEDSGLIVPIGRWALHEACRQAAAWRSTLDPGLTVSVNLSAAQFRWGRVEQDVEDALGASGLDSGGLELELTESLLQHEDLVRRPLAALKAAGVKLSIDDFGTGYSSLAYLKRFPIDKLKIDQSFTLGVLTDHRDRYIVKAILDIAHGLEVRTIAEGVEEAGLARALRAMGCDEAQGYLYSRPLAAAEFEAWYASYRIGEGQLPA